MAQAAEIIDLASFRDRRRAVRQTESAPQMMPGAAAFAVPVVWMPVWFVPAWPVLPTAPASA